MLIVETYLDIVEGKGVGLFTKCLILQGAAYWVRDTTFDKYISTEEFENYTDLAKSFIKNYGFQERNGMWYLCIDNARFVNHDTFPNTLNNFNDSDELISCIATRDIQAGEEILCDYRKTCITCLTDMGFEEYIPS